MVQEFTNRNSRIEAGEIILGKDVRIGKNVNVKVRGKFSVGDYSDLGNDMSICGENVEIGKHFFHTKGLHVGGGGSQFFNAELKIGDRCVVHNNYINLCMPVTLGNDVGLSPDCQIITHGFWQSVLEGYPTIYEGVHLHDGVIVGQRTMILMGSTVAKNCVVGAQSVVVCPLTHEKAVYAGTPARLIRAIKTPTIDEQRNIAERVLGDYDKFIHHYYPTPLMQFDFPFASVQDFTVNLLTGEYRGKETKETDDFRDFLRRYGIRIYTSRPFGRVV